MKKVSLLIIVLIVTLVAGVVSAATYLTIVAGQNIIVGQVAIWNSGSTLYVMYMTQDNWVMTDTHLHVAKSLAEIPKNKKGNPKIGKFNYQASYDPPVTVFMYTIPNAGDPGELLFIAAHAVVWQEDELGNLIREETAWTGCESNEFGGNSWATYFTYTMAE